MTKHLVKALERELEITRKACAKQTLLFSKIEEWLEEEVNSYNDLQERIESGEKAIDICDNPEAFYYRAECAESLLEQMKEWEESQ